MKKCFAAFTSLRITPPSVLIDLKINHKIKGDNANVFFENYPHFPHLKQFYDHIKRTRQKLLSGFCPLRGYR